MLDKPPPFAWRLSPGRYGTEGELLMLKEGRIAVGGARWNSLQVKDGPRTQSYKAYMMLPGFKTEEQQSDHKSMEQAKAWVEHHFTQWLIAAGFLRAPDHEALEEPTPEPVKKTFKRPVVPQRPERPKLQRK